MARKPTDTVQLKLRFSEALRRRLEREAQRQDRSLNSEIVSRLDQSFRKSEDADLAADAFRAAFGEPTGDFLRALATAIWLIEKHTGKKWNRDNRTRFQVIMAMEEIMNAFVRPLSAKGIVDAVESELAIRKYLQADLSHDRDATFIHDRDAARAAALETLQKMGMAPSDVDIAEEATKRQAKPKNEGPKQ